MHRFFLISPYEKGAGRKQSLYKARLGISEKFPFQQGDCFHLATFRHQLAKALTPFISSLDTCEISSKEWEFNGTRRNYMNVPMEELVWQSWHTAVKGDRDEYTCTPACRLVRCCPVSPNGKNRFILPFLFSKCMGKSLYQMYRNHKNNQERTETEFSLKTPVGLTLLILSRILDLKSNVKCRYLRERWALPEDDSHTVLE